MRTVVDSLNEMSFQLPVGFKETNDKYPLPNGQGFINLANYASGEGQVISLFGVYRDPTDFFEYYDNFVKNLASVSDKYTLRAKCTLKLDEFLFPTYFIAMEGQDKLACEVFVNCSDKLACFIVYIDSFDESIKKTIDENATLSALVKLLRTLQ